MPAAGIFHVGELRVDHFVIGRAERQTPQLFAGRLAGGKQPIAQFIVIGEQPGVLLAKSDEKPRP